MHNDAQSEETVRELPPPDGIEAGDAWEVMRAWVIDGELGVSMRAEVVQDPEKWGELLADLARYVVALFANETESGKPQDILDDVIHGFTERLVTPSGPEFDDPDT